MSVPSDDENKDQKSNSDLSDLVQWGKENGSNLPTPPPPLNNLELPPPPPPENLEIPPPPALNTLEIPPPPILDNLEIPPPPAIEEEKVVEIEEMEIPPPPAIESVNLLDSIPAPPPPEPESIGFSIPEELSETIEEVIDVTEVEESEYKSLWKRTSDKPLQQVYGHIDRIGTGEIGSLLDRYADRFGSELDREIIVLRQQERQQKMQELHQVPIVELIEDEVEEDSEETSIDPVNQEVTDEIANELEDELDLIEDEILEIEESYNAAKKKKKKAEIKKYGDELNSLFERRDAINAILDGDEDIESLAAEPEVAKTLEEDLFEKFVGIVDDLLGKLPEKELESFLESKDFEIYKSTASDPNSTSEKDKGKFFKLVNDKLAKLPEDVINEFIASENWVLYEEMGELYN